MDNIQTNTKAGSLTLPSANSLEGKNGLLAKLTANGVALPTSINDDVPYVIVDGGESEAGVKPLSRGEQVRVCIKGTCNMGDLLCLAEISGEDAGKVRALPSASGSYAVIGIAEESAEDGQAVLVRAYSKSVTI